MSIIQGTSVVSEAGYLIERSLRFNSADSAYLNRTPGSASDRKTWTWSGWVKLGANDTEQKPFLFAGTSGNDRTHFNIDGGNTLSLINVSGGSVTGNLVTTPVYRDHSAWYHFVVAIDTTQATASNRIKIYVNGSQITTFGTSTYPSQNADLQVNSTNTHIIGRYNPGPSNYLNGYLTEINFIDGSALTPSSFGQTNAGTGVWEPIKYTGTYGTNGFYLNFKDNSSTSALGTDYSGNGNTWTTNNFSVTAGAGNDSLVDTPTLYGVDTGAGGTVRGNYATLNGVSIGADATLANGNLDISYGSSGTRNATMGTFGMSSGKWYWEVTITVSSVSPTAAIIGITNQPSASAVSNYPGFAANGWGYSGSDANKYNNGSGTAYGATFTTNDVIGFAFDADAGSITAYKNGVSQGVMFSSLAAGTYYPAIGDGSALSTFSAVTNFGQRPFAYTAPSGFKALCTTNLPTPTIAQGDDYFNTVLYTGNGSTQSITGVGFQPDFVWLKARSSAFGHGLFDVIRGATKRLSSDGAGAEGTESGVTSFDSNGFSIGSATFGNNSGTTMVGWNWKANGAGVTNTDGTITSTVSANTTAGFSIVTWAGNSTSAATVGHGLGVAPKMIITKSRSNPASWPVGIGGISGFGVNDYLVLNSTNAKATSSTFYQAYGASTFTVGVSAADEMNKTGNNYVSYCFSEVPGYSAFGSYTGNGSTDGPFVYTGFRPRFVLVKNASATAGWCVLDSSRSPYNVANELLRADTSSAETSAANVFVDFTSNGFKIRNTVTEYNGNTNTIIFAAFSEHPFKYSLAR